MSKFDLTSPFGSYREGRYGREGALHGFGVPRLKFSRVGLSAVVLASLRATCFYPAREMRDWSGLKRA